jgi:hypothetical protein
VCKKNSVTELAEKRHCVKVYTSILLKRETSTYMRLYYSYIITQDLILLYVTVYVLSSLINMWDISVWLRKRAYCGGLSPQ